MIKLTRVKNGRNFVDKKTLKSKIFFRNKKGEIEGLII